MMETDKEIINLLRRIAVATEDIRSLMDSDHLGIPSRMPRCERCLNEQARQRDGGLCEHHSEELSLERFSNEPPLF